MYGLIEDELSAPGPAAASPLRGRGAVVTGAASGIGKAIATAFVNAGARVLLCDINREALETVAAELGDRATGRVTNVADEA